eukprot:6488672-Amphidinium_carterae.7
MIALRPPARARGGYTSGPRATTPNPRMRRQATVDDATLEDYNVLQDVELLQEEPLPENPVRDEDWDVYAWMTGQRFYTHGEEAANYYKFDFTRVLEYLQQVPHLLLSILRVCDGSLMIGDEDQYRALYISCNDVSKIFRTLRQGQRRFYLLQQCLYYCLLFAAI